MEEARERDEEPLQDLRLVLGILWMQRQLLYRPGLGGSDEPLNSDYDDGG